ncbi:hypothetical protein [Bacillus sp. AFS053548]|uniref:hypothetical protein n=1 Tax=Bacillus sp. AFS053548 TaxID=2033505 RepID=UPI00159BDDA2|nr:hypothetical protein [Bacillus sp. AFS053548]
MEGMKSKWKDLIKNISEEAEFNEPATQKQIEEIQVKFNLELPNELIILNNA